jgi:hypothetical protein
MKLPQLNLQRPPAALRSNTVESSSRYLSTVKTQERSASSSARLNASMLEQPQHTTKVVIIAILAIHGICK